MVDFPARGKSKGIYLSIIEPIIEFSLDALCHFVFNSKVVGSKEVDSVCLFWILI